MFTDIVGYTSLMGNDENRAFELLRKNRQLQKPIIERFNGRWIKELGDGVMASFNTVSDAVNAAIKIQAACNALKEFQLRIGIHMGEVVFENDDVFGDGVNIAARIQAIANPGSIFISEVVHDNVLNKKDIVTRFVKAQPLKNVKEPVKIYEVVTAPDTDLPTSQVAQKIKPTPKTLVVLFVIIALSASGYFLINFLPTKKVDPATHVKSIAILPFTDMSPGKDQEYLSDGLADEIINSITIIKDLKVIGRTSSFQYKGKDFDARTIGDKLGVNIILEGSIQKSGNILRIITKLISVKEDSTIWSQRFDKESKDIFAIQDSIANKIVEKLKITLSQEEKPRLNKKQTDPEVYSLYLKGLYAYKEQNYDRSIEYNQQAVALDSSFAPAYAFLALAKIWKINGSSTYTDVNVIRETKEFANRSVALDPNLAEGYSALALLAWTIELDYPTAKMNFEKSIKLNPSASLIKNRYAYFLLWMGEFDKAEKLGLDAISSDPADWNGYVIVASANMYKKKFTEAEKYIAEGKKLFPEKWNFDHLYFASKFYSGNYASVIQGLNPRLLKNAATLSENLLSLLCISYLKEGKVTESKELLHLLEETQGGPSSSVDYNLARIYSQNQMTDSCFASLERSFLKREPEFIKLKIDPFFDHLKQDQRYQQLYHQYGFDRYK
ncbi:MAG: adenylate/guanylate cyclase domain-containing protein [Maribacter sp.]|nr:adenylate/guanylate cyclase domain-containing protein [Maribacter sp.]